MKNNQQLQEFALQVDNFIKETISDVTNQQNLSANQMIKLQEFYKIPTSIQKFQELYWHSMLRNDDSSYTYLVDEINQHIHSFFVGNQSTIQNILSIERGETVPNSQNDMELEQNEIIQQSQTTYQNYDEEIEIAQIQQIKKKYIRQNKSPNSEEMKCLTCVCQGKPISNDSGSVIQCIICLNYNHVSCLGTVLKDGYKLFVCTCCVLSTLNLYHKINKVLVQPTLFSATHQINSQSFNFNSDTKVIDVRCVRLESKITYETPTWPDMSELYINSRHVHKWNPLQQNTCLKKRKDDTFIFFDAQFSNNVQLKECIPNYEHKKQYTIKSFLPHIVAVYAVEQMSHKQYIETVYKNPTNWMSVEQAQDFIILYSRKIESEEIEIDSVSVSLKCNITSQSMELPGRGTLCDHLQCFDLSNYCTMNFQMKPPQWRCQLCKQKIYGLIIDAYQLAIINTIKKYNLQDEITDVTFNKQGKIINEKLQSILTLDGIPDYGLSNNNRLICLEQLSSDNLQAYFKTQPAPKNNQMLSKTVNNMMMSTNQHLRVNTYAQFYGKRQEMMQNKKPQTINKPNTPKSAIVIE